MQNQRINWHIKGLVKIADLAYELDNMSQSANDKFKVLCFWDKHGLQATIDAFGITRRTLYYWRSKLKAGGKVALNDKSRIPIVKRKRQWDVAIIDEIRYLRQSYPNLGKDKLHPLLEGFCTKHRLPHPSISSIGRIISDDKDNMRVFPVKINHYGKRVKVNRTKVIRKPKDFKADYPGHCVALDTIEKRIEGSKHYILTFVDLYTRFAFAYATDKHTAAEASQFLTNVKLLFPYKMKHVLTDNGSEFKKEFDQAVESHWHTYPRTPKMNAHCERFNRTLQDELVDYNLYDLVNTDEFNKKMADYLLWYNLKRPHYALGQISPVDYIKMNEDRYKKKCNMLWTHTYICFFPK
jgi:transposase InsO family protein